MANTAKQLALACEHLRAGNFNRARSLYRRIVKTDPAHADAWHLLGIAAAGAGQTETAVVLIAKAVQLRGPVPEYCANLGRLLVQLGRHTEAASCFRQALAGQPLNARISMELGVSLAASGQAQAAVLAFEHASELDPANPEIPFQLGNLHFQAGSLRRAARCYERVLALEPNHARSQYNLGVIFMTSGQSGKARSAFERAVQLLPGYAEAHNNLAILAHAAGNYESAAAGYLNALRANPGFDNASYNLACLRQDRDELDQARLGFEQVLARCPGRFDAHLNLGNVLRALNETVAAIPHYRTAIDLSPESVDARYNLGLALLQVGQWEEGWRLHEWRHRQGPAFSRGVAGPTWDGSPLERRRILLHSEQGLGDTLQFARYAGVLRDMGGRVTLECHAPLARLLANLDGVEATVRLGEEVPEFDVEAPLMSLPAILETTPETLPCEVPYFLPDRETVEHWSDLLRQTVDPSLLRVGLTWAGNPAHKNDRNRSMPASALDALSGAAGIAWFNLQKDAQVRPALPLHEMVERCTDFADTAAAVLNLDLVISVDTAIAHLAGAMGKPVWTLLPFAADWRWMLDRSDSPWYPTMRLFRQPKRGDWTSVINSVHDELEKMVEPRQP